MTNNIKNLIIIWIVIIFLNQVILFGACFKMYCLINAIPHTFVIAFVINMIFKDKQNE